MYLACVMGDAVDEAEEFVSFGGSVRVGFRFLFGGTDVLAYEVKVSFASCW